MANLKKIARRSFLVGTAVLAGGVAFGTYAFLSPHENPLMDGLDDSETAITPFFKIGADGITLITPHADVGQGASSIQAYLLAEELDVDPLQVKLSSGEAAPAYYNAALLREFTPFAATNDSWMAGAVRDFTAVPAKLLAMQMTGGSSTVPDSYDKLRTAAATARETIKEAVAKDTGIDRENLKTEDGHVILPNGSKRAYTDLVPILKDTDPISDVKLRPKSQWKYLGADQTRTDIVAKSTGTQMYAVDLAMENMVYASVRTNPAIGAGVKAMNFETAKTMRGVQKIIPIENGVAVIADNTWRCFKALDAIDIEWEPTSYPAASSDMWDVLEKSFDPDFQDSRKKDLGDVEEALNSSDVIEAEYRIPYLAHAPLEPMNAVVLVSEDQVDIWTATQIPGFMQGHVASLTGFDKANIKIHKMMAGGSFGRRLEDTYVLQAVEIAMSMKGTPVKMTWSREEDMSHDYPRPMQLSKARGSVSENKVDAYDLSIISSSVTSSWFKRLSTPPPGPDVMIVAGAWDQPFDIPNYRVTGYRAPEMVPVSSWRSVGASGNAFLHAGFLDELFTAAGVDPLDEMIRICTDDTSRKVLEGVKELSNWTGSSLGEGKGRGVAFAHSFGVPVAQVVDVSHSSQGVKIDNVYVVADVGTVLDPINLDAQLMGGTIFGLGHAMNCELTYKDFAPEQTNYHQFEAMRLYQASKIMIKALENGRTIRGAGEPAVPPAAPALANAIFAATGQRIREMPMNKHIDFV